jgi:LPXTG-motif cell wall-anchored protein
MTFFEWLALISTAVGAVLIGAAGVVTWRRRRALKGPRESGWLTDEMVDRILREGRLEDRYVPDEGLDLEEIQQEEDRFWSETWDEPDAYLE